MVSSIVAADVQLMQLAYEGADAHEQRALLEDLAQGFSKRFPTVRFRVVASPNREEPF